MNESPLLVFRTLERAVARAVADERDLVAARDEWNRLAGKVHDDEPLYEERAGAFLEWCALERRGDGAPPIVERLLTERTRDAAPTEELAALTALCASHRSLFRVRAITVEDGASGLLLDDVWGGGAFLAKERRQLAGINPGDILDARLVADVESPPELLLTRILCVHPREAEPAVRRHIERARRDHGARADLLFLLLRLRVRCERYRHMQPARIYAAGDSFKER